MLPNPRSLLIATSAVCFLTFGAAAQTPSNAGRTSGDAMNSAKTGAYYERYADELRAKQRMEHTRNTLKTPRFRQALGGGDGLVTLNTTVGRFVTGGGTPFLAVQVGLPAGTKPGTSLTLFGEVVDAAGKVLSDFEVPSTVLESKGDLFLEYSLLSGAGLSARFGVARGDQVLGVANSALSAVDAAGEPAREISQLIVSNNVFNLSEAQKPFEPFAFGGTKVIPKPDRIFRSADEAWLFVELREQNAKAPTPAVSIRAAVEGEGRTITGAWQPAEVLPLKGVGGHFGVGTTVDLSSLKPGDYRITLSVRDETAKQVVERMQTISIR
ncbi:MAG: hypothetical protein QOH21_1534, partial [Acidobacteriota bacterium]|nr:hypothetical protein [Acidobacteriota bacterium]